MSHRWSEPTAATSLLNAVAAESVVRRFCPTKERATKDVAVLGTARQQQGACFGQFRGRELKVYRRSDERIQDVSNRLSYNSSTDASKIQLSVHSAESF